MKEKYYVLFSLSYALSLLFQIITQYEMTKYKLMSPSPKKKENKKRCTTLENLRTSNV
jgi:hypothetical protein